jgi:hypothetical protein
MNDSTATLVVLSSLVALVGLIIGLGIFFWYAAALSRVFSRRGVESWRAWVPVLNEAEILRLGGRPGWAVVFFFIPVVCVYAIVLRALAANRIGRTFGRGGGATVLAVLLPPVWATVLASSREPAAAEEPVPARSATPPPKPEDQPHPAPVAPIAEPPLAVVPPVPVVPVPVASLVPVVPVPVAQEEAVTPPAELATAAPSPTGPSAPAPGARAEDAAVDDFPPIITPFMDAPADLPSLAPAAPQPVAPQSVAPEPVAPEPVAPEPVAPEPVAPEPVAPGPVAPASIAPTPPPVEEHSDIDIDDAAETVVVERAPVVAWSLVTDDGGRYPLEADVVVLGRRPAGDEPGVQYLAVPDTSRTLSKQHACLARDGDSWIVTDLGSTNGVFLDLDGVERPLPPGDSAPVSGRLLLGTVGLRIERGDAR